MPLAIRAVCQQPIRLPEILYMPSVLRQKISRIKHSLRLERLYVERPNANP